MLNPAASVRQNAEAMEIAAAMTVMTLSIANALSRVLGYVALHLYVFIERKLCFS